MGGGNCLPLGDPSARWPLPKKIITSEIQLRDAFCKFQSLHGAYKMIYDLWHIQFLFTTFYLINKVINLYRRLYSNIL